jgi:hypothetical protein
MSPSLPAAALPWLVAGWIATVVVIAVLIYLIARQVLSKTEPQSMPEVLRALTPLLSAVIRPLAKLPIGSPADKELPSGQTGIASAESDDEKAS